MDNETIERIASAKMIDLGHPMASGMPNHSSHPPYIFTPHFRYGDFELADGYWGTNELIVMSGHSGTHVDAVAHVACHGVVFGGIEAGEAQKGVEGLQHHSIDSVEPVLRRGVLLDVARHNSHEILEPSHGIDADELEQAAGSAGIEVQQGDCVLIRTGWARHWNEPGKYLGEEGGAPGITVDAGRWLAEKGVYLVGSDNAVVERIEVGGETLPVHMLLLAKHGVLLLENLNLEDLSSVRSYEFLFVCLPLRLRGASGSPVRPVAVV